MNKKKMILTSLASVAVLGAAFVASQPSVVKADDKPAATQPAGDSQPTPAAETPKTEVEKAKEAEKEANAKVAEAQAKVDITTPVADEAAKKLETEKKEAADAEAAKTKKEEADKAKAKVEEEVKKEEEAKKEEAETKTALKDALDQLEEDAIAEINKDASITDKEKAIADKKAEIGKEAILDAVEKGDLSAKDILKELENDYNTRNKAPEKVDKTKKLDAEEAKKIAEVAKKEASKPIVKKLTAIADDLAEKIEKLTKAADK